MRNFKRVLSLALALVMVIGMMVMGAGAAGLTDYDEIEYKEAVSVAQALKIIDGLPNGAFNPKGELTREGAAILVCRLVCGRENADKLIKAFLPGPLTIIIKKQPDVPDIVTSSSQKVGIRIPDDRFALELIRRTGPIVATSANLHSKPDSVDVNAAINDFGDSVDTYIDAGPCSLGQPSTIVWLMDKEVEIIRQGAISVEKIKEVLEC